jgi:hypothetical protein
MGVTGSSRPDDPDVAAERSHRLRGVGVLVGLMTVFDHLFDLLPSLLLIALIISTETQRWVFNA